MDLLRTITIAYAGVLVAALAVSLTFVLIYLRRIGSKLADILDSLQAVERGTKPFQGRFEVIRREVERSEEASLDLSSRFASAARSFDPRAGIPESS